MHVAFQWKQKLRHDFFKVGFKLKIHKKHKSNKLLLCTIPMLNTINKKDYSFLSTV